MRESVWTVIDGKRVNRFSATVFKGHLRDGRKVVKAEDGDWEYHPQ